jgi:photosystem II stability/assembly factor-like uncharacterized protein
MRIRPLLVLAASVAVGAAALLALPGRHASRPEADPTRGPVGERQPADWFGLQRAFPFDHIPQERWRAAVEQARLDRALASLGTSAGSLVWQQAGPYNIGGRITALAVVPGGTTVYLASANGGVFKSTNAGVNWTPIFDAFSDFSIGALALEPGNPSTLYVGTGEANASVDSYDGGGLYRSRDGGATWQFLGLEATARIARVAVDPGNPGHVLVAAMGPQFSTSPDRGLYRTLDGGATWSRVLSVTDSTGACDVVFNARNPDTVYAATWERIRRPTYRRAYGPSGGIWRSTDRGATWTRLTSGLPPFNDNLGRIGLVVAPSNPSIVYAQIINGAAGGYAGLGMYRTTNGGATWTRRDVAGFTTIFGGFGWYFGDMGVDPVNPDRVYAMGVNLRRSTDGGASFFEITGSAHVDQHAIWIDPSNPDRIYLGNDGGFYWSTDGAASWNKSLDLPITQFYAGTIDPSDPNRLLGGTQDNNTLITAGSPSGWYPILGGDGFQCVVDPVGPDTLFAEYQFGSYGSGVLRSTDGGANFSVPTGFSTSDRYNWNTPVVMHPRDHHILLVGSQRVYKSVNNGQAYTPVSGDLTRNIPAGVVYSTITTLEISPADTALYYAGTDDGRVWRSENAGATWSEISAGLPVRYVTRVTADPADPQVAYVTLSGFGLDEPLAHVYRTTDRGGTWTSIAAGLPDVPANDVLVDPADTATLYLATDVGVYATRDLGAGWFPLGAGMPAQAVFDLTLHAPSRTLVAATHGRSQWRLDLGALPAAAGRAAAAPRLALGAPAPNPSRGTVAFALELPNATAIDVAVYDPQGRRVATLRRGALGAGRHALAWDGRDAAGRRVGPGVYFVRASAGGASATRRVVRAD